MKNKRNEYVGLTDEDKKYLKEFDDALENGYFKDEKIKFTKEEKKVIKKQKEIKDNCMMNACQETFKKSKQVNEDNLSEAKQLNTGKKRVESPRGTDGRYIGKSRHDQ